MIPITVHASELLESILEHLNVAETSRWDYQETRAMALLQEEWKAQGSLYLSPTWMAIKQQSPKFSLVLISETELRYAEPENKVYVRKPLKSLPVGVSGLDVFLKLAFQEYDKDTLSKEYFVNAYRTDGGWKLLLQPRDTQKLEKIGFEGTATGSLISIRLTYVDGDSTNWQLGAASMGEVVQKELDEIILQFDEQQVSGASDLR